MSNKIHSLQDYKQSKQKKERKMLFIVIIVGILGGLLSWQFFVENIAALDVQIPESKNITYNAQTPIASAPAQIADEMEKYDGKPILLYLYTTWCSVCKTNFSTLNEIAREFQNTDLHIIALAIDRDIDETTLTEVLNGYGDLYFQPRFLAFKEGFIELLKQKHINYQGRIPFTVLIGKDGKIITKYVGAKNKNYLRNKIIRELYQ